MKVSSDKTAFTCPLGKFEFSRMPFGLKNAPSVFHRLMDVIVSPCYNCCGRFVDFSYNWDEHVGHLRQVLGKLRKHGLTVKPSKCECGMKHVEYLGHIVGSRIVAVPEMQATAMKEFRKPVSKTDMRLYLGTVGYCRIFLEGFSNFSSILSPAITKTATARIHWSVEMEDAFRTLRGQFFVMYVIFLYLFCLTSSPSRQRLLQVEWEVF